MTEFLTTNARIPPYLAFPRFLFSYDLTETAKLLYMLLLDRARVSMKNEDWVDQDGRVFLYFTIRNLARELKRSEMTIKKCLKALENADLIVRRRQAPGLPNRIYVKIPVEQGTQTDRKLSLKGKENCPFEGQKSFPLTERKVSTSNKEKNNNQKDKQVSNTPSVFGRYKNVYLSDEEYADLKRRIPDAKNYIERLSSYMKSSGKTYQNHAATIEMWADRDKKPSYADRKYEHKEDESL